MQLTKGLITSK